MSRLKNGLTANSGRRFFVSRISLAEIRFGIECHPDQIKRQEFTYWLENIVRIGLLGKILEVDEDVIVRWRHLMQEGRKQRYTYSQPDLFIAATASGD